MVLRDSEFIFTWMRFLDVFWGRGGLFIYLAMRIMPLGQLFCLITGPPMPSCMQIVASTI